MSHKRDEKHTTFEYVYILGRTYEVRPYLSAMGVALTTIALLAVPAILAMAVYVTFNG